METNTISARTRLRAQRCVVARGGGQAELGDKVSRALREQVRNRGIQDPGDCCRDFPSFNSGNSPISEVISRAHSPNAKDDLKQIFPVASQAPTDSPAGLALVGGGLIALMPLDQRKSRSGAHPPRRGAPQHCPQSLSPCPELEPRSARWILPGPRSDCFWRASSRPAPTEERPWGNLPRADHPAVGVVEATRRPITETNEFLGRIEAVNRVNVVARVTGFLEGACSWKAPRSRRAINSTPSRAGTFRGRPCVEAGDGGAVTGNAGERQTDDRTGPHPARRAGRQQSTYDAAIANQRSLEAQVQAAQAQVQASRSISTTP